MYWIDRACIYIAYENSEAYGEQAKAGQSSVSQIDTETRDNKPPRKVPEKPHIISSLRTFGLLNFLICCFYGGRAIIADEPSLGFAIAGAGGVQVFIFLGFSAIIEQLYNINKNTFPQ